MSQTVGAAHAPCEEVPASARRVPGALLPGHKGARGEARRPGTDGAEGLHQHCAVEEDPVDVIQSNGSTARREQRVLRSGGPGKGF